MMQKHVEVTALIVLIVRQVQSVRASVGTGLLPSAHDEDELTVFSTMTFHPSCLDKHTKNIYLMILLCYSNLPADPTVFINLIYVRLVQDIYKYHIKLT